MSENVVLSANGLDAIEAKIITVRGQQVIMDRDLAILYQVDLAQMNRQVKRNIERFPPDFMFRLTKEETASLKCHFGISNSRGGDRSLPYAFTEQGVSMLSGLLRSGMAIQVNILIMRAFVAMRNQLSNERQIVQRIDTIEYRQLAAEKKIQTLFKSFDKQVRITNQGIFYDGQIFDAYLFVSKLIKGATKEIALIDNYIDETVLALLDKRESEVKATIYTKAIDQRLRLDIQRHNEQYAPIEIRLFGKAHDRFLIIDDSVYHIGASLKDLGKKWFAFSLMRDLDPQELIQKISGDPQSGRG